MRSQLHMTIDRIKCDGHGLCAELLPEMIRLDDWGYPIIAAGPISDRLEPHAQRAVAACPTLALALRRTAPSK
jgi:ferredoxin